MAKSIQMKPRIERNADGGYTVVYEDPAIAAKDSADLSRRIDRLIGKSPPNISGLDALKAALGAVLHLSDRLKKIEAMPHKSLADAYKGIHLKNGEYSRSDLVTHDGGLWLALADTKESPGQSTDWKLVVKGAR
jgi:hypothetical protein